MDKLLGIAQQNGAAGLIFLAAGWFVIYLLRQHKAERLEVTNSLLLQHTECMEARREAKEALVNNTTVLTEIATLIRNRPIK